MSRDEKEFQLFGSWIVNISFSIYEMFIIILYIWYFEFSTGKKVARAKLQEEGEIYDDWWIGKHVIFLGSIIKQ